MQSAFIAIAPIFFVIMVGFLAYRFSFIDDNTIKVNNALVFYLFLPALLIYKVANSDIKTIFNINMVIVLYLSVFIVFAASFAVSKIFKINKESIGAIVISSFRGNFAYMGLPIAFYLFANKGIVISSILVALIVPFVNILTIFALSSAQQNNYKKIIKDSILTPIVLASFIGILLSIYNIKLPVTIEHFLKILSLPALTLALLGIGASLRFKEITKKPKEILLSALFKLMLLPFIGVILLHILPIGDIQAKVTLIMLASPPATLNYIMAQQMNADTLLVSANICIATVLSFLSYMFWIYYIKYYF